MAADNFFRQAIEGATFSFTARPEPVAGDLRMSWGIGVLLLSLFYARGKKGSFPKLQFLAHAIRTQEGREDVRALMAGRLRTTDISVRVEPWLNRAVSYAHGLGFVDVTKGKSVGLTEKGREVAAALDADKSVFKEERAFLAEVTKKLTEAQLTKIWRMEDLL
ncbi:hypothetical protein [Methylobacterium nodulans]|uniref:Uncharacterized protein n=1 Tax=Methylobacterium nodulans (strain LMG 21967 / CNCM I-2342 / ORS 2060) TaxID=460265 RepID=B8I9N3_METNO|nr:hypothetical protein [Methylobacterium nodulans]ACL55286.1 conserved hypothetical protein [Methylobacterium nodulans ORS 2060]